ncbi:hypothetical protein C8Q80DRAFT_4193 [Daedaleopsis nitida]|nr:hypothetical protein C8Q80DRAFT_4193 [Daedaleopsis nitida]
MCVLPSSCEQNRVSPGTYRRSPCRTATAAIHRSRSQFPRRRCRTWRRERRRRRSGLRRPGDTRTPRRRLPIERAAAYASKLQTDHSRAYSYRQYHICHGDLRAQRRRTRPPTSCHSFTKRSYTFSVRFVLSSGSNPSSAAALSASYGVTAPTHRSTNATAARTLTLCDLHIDPGTSCPGCVPGGGGGCCTSDSSSVRGAWPVGL